MVAAASRSVGERLDNAKLNRRHVKIVGLVGAATFFDAFDALSIAYVMPILVGAWSLAPTQIGLTISAGYVGQLIGALVLGWFAERRGRIGALRWAVGIMSVMSVACAFVTNLPMLMVARLIQGIGLGGEVPIAATYVNEWSPSHLRGRIVFLFQTLFATGVALTALIAAVVVPHLGWRFLFAMGAIPAILFLLFGRRLPESPRWLAANGRAEEAGRIIDAVEGKALSESAAAVESPTVARERPRFASLLSKDLWKRTVVAWLILFCTSAVGYGLLTWLPTLYRTVYHLSVQDAFQYSVLNNMLGLLGALTGALFIDRLGRKLCFGVAFSGAALPLLALWMLGLSLPPVQVMAMTSVASFFISVMLAGIYVYVPEIYPTRIRALGASTATAWYRLAAILSPSIVGLLLTHADVTAVYLFFGVMAAIGAVVVFGFALETRGRRLEEISQ